MVGPGDNGGRGERGERWSGEWSERGGSGGSGDRVTACRGEGWGPEPGAGAEWGRRFHEDHGAPVDGSTAGRAYRSSCLIICALLSLHWSTCRRRLEGERAPTLSAYPTPKIFYCCRRVVSARTSSDAFVPAFIRWFRAFSLVPSNNRK